MKSFLERISSRKFLVAIGAEVGALVTLLSKEATGDLVADAIIHIGTIAVMGAIAVGYIAIQGKIDTK